MYLQLIDKTEYLRLIKYPVIVLYFIFYILYFGFEMKNKTMGLLAALSMLAPLSAQAAVQLPEGTQEFGVQGAAKIGSDWDVTLNGSYGVFIRDNWQVGGTTTVSAKDHNDELSAKFGAFTEYNFVNSTQWVPYIGAAAEVAGLSFSENGVDGNVGEEGDSWALNIELAAGIKYFVSPNIAISAEMNYNIATDDIDFSSDKASNSLTNFVIGTRYYF